MLLRVVTLLVSIVLVLGPQVHGQDAGHFFDSDGVQIRYDDRGAGEPVVLVHGGFANARMWDTLGITAALADADYRVITFDMRGHGASGKPHDPKQYGLEMSHDIARLLDHLRIIRAHVVGYSLGALVANRFRGIYPDRTLTAILGGGGPLIEIEEESSWIKRAPEITDAILRGDIGPMVRMLAPQQPQDQIDAMYARLSATNDMQAVATAMRAQAFADPVDELRSNEVPTLALIGANDPNKTMVDAVVPIMTNLTVVVIPGADHGEAVGDPLFLEETLKFLAAHRPRDQRIEDGARW